MDARTTRVMSTRLEKDVDILLGNAMKANNFPTEAKMVNFFLRTALALYTNKRVRNAQKQLKVEVPV